MQSTRLALPALAIASLALADVGETPELLAYEREVYAELTQIHRFSPSDAQAAVRTERQARFMLEVFGLPSDEVFVNYGELPDTKLGNHNDGWINVNPKYPKTITGTIIHEFWHAVQSGLFGDLWKFKVAYAAMNREMGYEDNPFERECRMVANYFYSMPWDASKETFEAYLVRMIDRLLPSLRLAWREASLSGEHLTAIKQRIDQVRARLVCIRAPTPRHLNEYVRIIFARFPGTSVNALCNAALYIPAYLLNAGMEALMSFDNRRFFEAAKALGDSTFWAALGVFTAVSGMTQSAIDAIAKAPFIAQGARALSQRVLPLAAGVSAVEVILGHGNAQRAAVTIGSFVVATAVVDLAEVGLCIAVGLTGPVGWGVALVINVVKLTATLYLGDQIQKAINSATGH